MNKLHKIIVFIFISFTLSHIAFGNTEDIFYYNNEYKKDKEILFEYINKDIYNGVNICLNDIGKKYFNKDKDLAQYCIYQLIDYINKINHKLNDKYNYDPVAESNFFFNNGINIINNKLLLFIDKKDNKLTKNIINDNELFLYDGIYINETIKRDLGLLNNKYKENFRQDIIINSGYRSILQQQSIYNYYQKTYGQEQSIATIPGGSEHHLGTAIDIKKVITTENQLNYNWLDKNAWKYGFIRTYDYYCMNELGIVNEDWHFRWVGKEISKKWKLWKYDNKETCNALFLLQLNNK